MSGNDVLSSELELLDSMFSSTPASLEPEMENNGDDKCCYTIISKYPRFMFHIYLKAESE
jgi:hypothetical protein